MKEPMTLDKLIETLRKLREQHGDVLVRVQSLTHLWEPEPVVKQSGEQVYVLLNP